MTTPTKTRQMRDWSARRACETAQKLERAGDYEGAREALGKFWTAVGERPAVDQLPTDTRAEVLLRVGALQGWVGSAKQVPGAQESARDLISESLSLFESLGELDRCAEALTDLGLCYWRSGSLDEGRVYFQEALMRAQSADTKLRAMINATTVEISSARYLDALTVLNGASALLAQVTDEAIQGKYHLQRALVYNNLGGAENIDKSLVEYSAASLHLANAGHTRYLARVENNIGFILLQLGRSADALDHLDRARRIFISLKDSGSVAQVNETRARVLIAEKRFVEAERAAFMAITTLEQGDEQSLLAEALTTQAIAFARSGRSSDAHKAFHRASEVAAAAGDTHASAIALFTMIDEINAHLTSGELFKLFQSANQQLDRKATLSDLQQVRRCSGIVLAAIENSQTVSEDEMIGGTLEQERFHFEARLIRRALDQTGGSLTEAARKLGITHQGLSFILDGRHNKTLGRARKEKRVRRKSIIPKQ